MKDYIGRCQHGNVVSWMTGDATPKEVRSFVSSLLKNGMDIDRMDREEARVAINPCRQCDALRDARKGKK